MTNWLNRFLYQFFKLNSLNVTVCRDKFSANIEVWWSEVTFSTFNSQHSNKCNMSACDLLFRNTATICFVITFIFKLDNCKLFIQVPYYIHLQFFTNVLDMKTCHVYVTQLWPPKCVQKLIKIVTHIWMQCMKNEPPRCQNLSPRNTKMPTVACMNAMEHRCQTLLIVVITEFEVFIVDMPFPPSFCSEHLVRVWPSRRSTWCCIQRLCTSTNECHPVCGCSVLGEKIFGEC